MLTRARSKILAKQPFPAVTPILPAVSAQTEPLFVSSSHNPISSSNGTPVKSPSPVDLNTNAPHSTLFTPTSVSTNTPPSPSKMEFKKDHDETPRSPDQLVNSRIEVYWPRTGKFFPATVKSPVVDSNPRGSHLVKYDDEDELFLEWLDEEKAKKFGATKDLFRVVEKPKKQGE